MFLDEIANRNQQHSFLGGPTQQVYLRQVSMIEHVSNSYFGKKPDDISLLDWGCGKGHISHLFFNKGFKVLSFDVSFSDSPIWSEGPLDKPTIGTHPYQLPFDDNSFDIAVSFGVLEHVPQENKSLAELHRVVKPGGLLFITFLPYHFSYTQHLSHFLGDWYHDRLYGKKQAVELIESHNFKVININHGQLFPKNRVPAILRRFDFENLDRMLTEFSPLKYLATNLELVVQNK